MKEHDIFEEAVKQKSLVEKLNNSQDSKDIEDLLKNAENPKTIALLMFRVLQEREKTNAILNSINEKFDTIMLSLKTSQSISHGFDNANSNKFEVLSEADQLILKSIEERGGCTAQDIKAMLNYKGLNAACQRLNKLYREGFLKKVQAGKKVLYLAKSKEGGRTVDSLFTLFLTPT